MKYLPRITALVFAGLLSLLKVSAQQAPACQWANGIAGNYSSWLIGDVDAVATAITASGAVYAGYEYNGAITLGNRTYFDSLWVLPNSVLAYYDAAGQFTHLLLEGRNAFLDDIKLDSAGNLYATGRFSGRLVIGNTQATAQSVSDFYIAKWDAAGTLSWLVRGTNVDSAYTRSSLAVDRAGRVTMVGKSAGVTFNRQSLSPIAPDTVAMFMVQLDASGAVRWLRGSAPASASATSPDVYSVDLAAAPDGTLHLIGYVERGLEFAWGTTPVPVQANQRFYWLQLDADGVLVQQQSFGSARSWSAQIATDQVGAPYLTCSLDSANTFRWGNTAFALPNNQLAGAFILKIGTNGTPLWAQPLTIGSSAAYVTVDVLGLTVADDQLVGGLPRVYVTGSIAPTSTQMVCGAVAFPALPADVNSYVMALDGQTGTATWLAPLASASDFSTGNVVAANAAGAISVAGNVWGDTAQIGSFALPPPYDYYRAAFVAKLVQNFNRVQGTVFTDTNRNATRDAGESGRASVIVEAQPGPLYFSTTTGGAYNAITELGTYTMSVPNPPRYYSAVPGGPVSATFGTYGNLAAGRDVALQTIPGQQDLQVLGSANSNARAGRRITYYLTASNVGTVAVPQSTLHLTYSRDLTYSNATQPPTTSGINSLSWDLGALPPGATQTIEVEFEVAITVSRGHVLRSTVALDHPGGDLTPADNEEVISSLVTAAYDPNDITVNYPWLSLAQVQAGTPPLDYTIRFQNVGNDTAFTVVIRDTLPVSMLQISALQMLSASHTMSWSLDANRVLTVRFPNIHLPDSTTNLAGSMGFVRFRLAVNPTLVVGDVIPNRAAIYFDFNAPVITNTATTTIGRPTGTSSETAATLSGGAWPNPATGTLHVALDLPSAAPLTVTLTDAVGRAVQTNTRAAAAGHFQTALDVSGLAPGLYLLRAQAAGRGFSQRIVVR